MKQAISGAVVGVLATLGVMFAVFAAADERWVTRREWVLMTSKLDRMERKLDTIIDRRDPEPPPAR